MKARIRILSGDHTYWEDLDEIEFQEAEHLVEEGESISTVALSAPFHFDVVRVRPGAVELAFRPTYLLYDAEPRRYVDSLTLGVGELAVLQTPTIDQWGNWLVSVIEVI